MTTDGNPTLAQPGAQVLVVDDDQYARQLLQLTLENEGYVIRQAGDGLEAVEIFQQLSLDLILLDLMMPRLDGFATCQRLRALPGGELTPIIVITALHDHTSLQRAFEAGAVDYITKPLDMTALKIRIRRSLQVRAAEEAVRRTFDPGVAEETLPLDCVLRFDALRLPELHTLPADTPLPYTQAELPTEILA